MVSIQEPTFLMLTALASRPLYGYAVIREVAELSHGRVQLRAGTLYAALDRLTDDGLVVADREEVVEGRLRRYYRLTDDGAAALTTAAHHLQENARAATEGLQARRAGDVRIGPAHA